MAGIFCLAHGSALVSGAYISTLLWRFFGISPWIGMLAGVVVAGLFGWLISSLGFRARLGALAFGLFTAIWGSIGQFVVQSYNFFDASHCISNTYVGTNIALFQFENPVVFYYIIVLLNIGAIILCNYILNSKFGLYLKAIHGNERFAAAAGINVIRYKTAAVTLSMMLYAVAGTFWAQYTRLAAAELAAVHAILFAILIVVLGGAGTLWGPVLGAAILMPIKEILRINYVNLPGLGPFLYGLVIIVILRTLGTGILNWYSDYSEKRRFRPERQRKETSRDLEIAR
jgi:branched-chain amino acid transport system permease protein